MTKASVHWGHQCLQYWWSQWIQWKSQQVASTYCSLNQSEPVCDMFFEFWPAVNMVFLNEVLEFISEVSSLERSWFVTQLLLILSDCQSVNVQYVEFLASSDSFFSSGTPHSKWSSNYVVSCEGPGVIAAGTTGKWNNVPMRIPSIAPSRLDGCRIINCNYVLKVCCKLRFLCVLSVGFFLGF